MNTDRGKLVLIFMSETVCWTTEQLQFEIKQQKGLAKVFISKLRSK
tara:strand:+ start:41 stop:178 length:138 start_codon:yes stop_codon:yes gene_type:complete